MIETVPTYLEVLFGLTAIVSVLWFYASTRSGAFLIIIISWTILQALLSVSGVYGDSGAVPPRIMLFGGFPALLTILAMFLTVKGRAFIDNINLKPLTYFHAIRIPVEIGLALLFHQGFVSEYMTFEGTNFDMFSGLTAPLVAYVAYRSGTVNKKLLLGWNMVCLLLLLNVVITSVFAMPSPFQILSMDQPNIAILYFPFSLLPTVIVPLVLFAHLVAFRQLKNGE